MKKSNKTLVFLEILTQILNWILRGFDKGKGNNFYSIILENILFFDSPGVFAHKFILEPLHHFLILHSLYNILI